MTTDKETMTDVEKNKEGANDVEDVTIVEDLDRKLKRTPPSLK